MEVQTQHYEFHDDDIKNCQSFNINTKSKLDQALYNIARREDYLSCDITIKERVADGGNFLANLYEVDIKGKTANGEKEIAIFAKAMTPEAIDIGIISLPSVYKTELFIYKELGNLFEEIQNEGHVPVEERFNTVKCYDESYEEAIIMENITRRGFKTWSRMKVVSLDMAEECIKQLARFHGLSLVLQRQRPEYFNKKLKIIKTSHVFGTAWKEYVEKFCKIGLDCLNTDVRMKIENKIRVILLKMEEYHLDESSMYCLCHGDYRPNNVLYREENGVVTEVIPVDYQLVYYACPIIDFLYFIYMATDRQFRRSHITYLKDFYYKSLDEFLLHFDMSAEQVIPRKVFENLYEEKLDYGLIVTFLYCPFVFLSENEDIPDLTREEILDIEFKFDDKFQERLTDAVEEFIELGYF